MASLGACSLLVETRGLSSDSDASVSGDDGASADGPSADDASTDDASADDATTDDATTDASADSGADADAGVVVENLMPSSNLSSTFLNDSEGVTIVTESVALPTGTTGLALKCTHTKQAPGYFRRGTKLTLTAGVTYTLSFFFKNETVASPWGTDRFDLGKIATIYQPSFDEFGAPLSSAVPYPDGWYRQVLTFKPVVAGVYEVGFNQGMDQAPIGTYRLFGFQLEKGSTASPYRATP